MDRNSHKRRLERFSRSERIFPGGEQETSNCGACARIIAERFGGEIRGYYHAHNPTARIGEGEGGHDFAITPDRFLVDPWLYHYYGEPPVLDMTVRADRFRPVRAGRELAAGVGCGRACCAACPARRP